MADQEFDLRESLKDYAKVSAVFFADYTQTEAVEQCLEFLSQHPEAFDASYFPGHFTGSALVVSKDYKRVLLAHHRKLNLWLQLGGHADNEKNLSQVAMREAQEESGLQNFSFVKFPAQSQVIPFDLDVHVIPARGNLPEHRHFDVRYLLVCHDLEENIQVSEESHDLKWFTWDEAGTQTQEVSMQRQFAKARRLLAH